MVWTKESPNRQEILALRSWTNTLSESSEKLQDCRLVWQNPVGSHDCIEQLPRSAVKYNDCTCGVQNALYWGTYSMCYLDY